MLMPQKVSNYSKSAFKSIFLENSLKICNFYLKIPRIYFQGKTRESIYAQPHVKHPRAI